MADTLAKKVEEDILASLLTAPHPIDMDRLVEQVRAADRGTRAVDVKIAAFNLVSRGQVGLNDQWQLSRTSVE